MKAFETDREASSTKKAYSTMYITVLVQRQSGWFLSNVFVLIGGRWRTPALDACGVAGICREHLLPLTGADVGPLSVDEVERADALLVCNAVRGILPVARLGRRTWPDHPAMRALQEQLAGLHPAFVREES